MGADRAKPAMVPFGPEHAAAYDKQFERVAPVREAMQLLTRLALDDAPDDARVLCVGAGTGLEVLYLAEAFPRWTFTAVDPSGPMLEVCQRRLAEEGVGARCHIHVGLLESLPDGEPFDVATSLLVSQFIRDRAQRVGYFREIARRLRPGGRLVTADIASDASAPRHDSLLEAWETLHRFSGAAPEKAADLVKNLEEHIALLAPHELEQLLEEAGFQRPVLFYQALLIHAWRATKPGGDR